jgi:hydrogenase maturation protease
MTEQGKNRTAVIGVGNILYGDDGFGPRVVERLQGEDLGHGVDVIDGGSIGIDLLDYLTEYDRVIIVDAAQMGLEPGELRVFTPGQVRSLEKGAPLSLHSADVLGVIKLAGAIGKPIGDVHIVAVQPQFVGPHDGLSETVRPALDGAAAQVRGLIGRA